MEAKQDASDQSQEPCGISRKDFARRFGISVSTLQNCIKRKEVRAIRLGTRVIIPMTELKRLTEAVM